MKKILSLFVAMVVLFSVGLPTLANTTGTITIKNTTATTGITLKDEKYEAYKVMSLVQGTSGSAQTYTVDSRFEKFFKDKASSGDDVTTPEKLNAFANKYINDRASGIDEVARGIKNYIDNSTVTITPDGTSSAITGGALVQSATINTLPLGYYIIVDKSTVSGHVIAASGLGTTNPNLTISLKASKPTIDKQIKDNDNDSWGKVGDNQIGDNVEFRLIGKLPTNITGYKNYTYKIHDTLAAAFSFNNDIEIYVGANKDAGKKLVAGTDYVIESPVNHPKDDEDTKNDGTHSFDISIKFLENSIKNSKLNLGDEIYVYYTAKLNENAEIVGKHNDNTVYLEYSNNPYDEKSTEKGTGITVRDYTFKLNATKTKEDGITPLEGAEFSLSKGGTAIKFRKIDLTDGTNEYVVSEDINASEVIISGSNGKFSIKGLDDVVEYTLRETKAPLGYNSISDIKFSITAGYNIDGDINSISATNGSGIIKVTDKYELGTTIINTKSTLLPGTGGIGTTIFTVAGGGLMLSAMALFVYKRRKRVS